MSKEIGPKERALREARERRFAENHQAKKPSAADLRSQISKVRPMTRKGGKRGR